MTRFTFSYARRASKYAAVTLGLFAGFGFIGAANAVQTGQVTITCAKPDGTERTFTVGWDNSNQYFDGKGDIARLFCEGGHSGGGYTVFVSTSVSDLSLRYYQGVLPIQDTVTSTSETQTAVVEETVTAPSTSDSPTVVQPDTSTVSAPEETSTAVLETETVSDSSTATIDTSTPTVDSSTSSVDTSTSILDTSTATSEQAPVETSPLPTPPPVVEPQPVPQPVPVVVPPTPQPEPQPEPAPEPLPEVIDEEAPSEEQPSEEQPVVEEQLPVEEPSELPVEEETNETPVEEPVIQEPSEPNPEPSPQPSAEPAPNSQPEIAYEPPTVTLDNGVILTQEEAVAVALLQNPGELLSELFTNPAAVLNALGSVGADMSPEVREKSEKVLVSAVIVGNIATQAAALAGAATYRRNQ